MFAEKIALYDRQTNEIWSNPLSLSVCVFFCGKRLSFIFGGGKMGWLDNRSIQGLGLDGFFIFIHFSLNFPNS